MMTSMISMKLLLLGVLKLWVSMRLPNVTKEGICVSTTIKVESKSKNVCLLWQLGRGQTYNSFCLFVEIGKPGIRSVKPELSNEDSEYDSRRFMIF